MKHILTFGKVSGSIAGVLVAFFIIVSVLSATAQFVIEDTLHAGQWQKIQDAKANCAGRGGKWITNPDSYLPFRIYGQGCTLDYERRAKLLVERASK